jgi:hypothetical protein
MEKYTPHCKLPVIKKMVVDNVLVVSFKEL